MYKHLKHGFEGKKGLQVEVRNGNIDNALKLFSRKIKREGLLRDLKSKNYFEKPSDKKRRRRAEAKSRWSKNPHNPNIKEM